MNYLGKDLNELSQSQLRGIYDDLVEKYAVAMFLLNDKESMIDILSKKNNVREYIKYKNELNSLTNYINNINKSIVQIEQHLCNHSDLFIYETISDMSGNNKVYNCKCLNCTKEMLLTAKDLKRKKNIISAQNECPASLEEYWDIKKTIDNSDDKKRLLKQIKNNRK